MSKYRAKKTEIDGVLFDSKAEARRYCELKLLAQQDKIKSLTLQPKFELIPRFQKHGKTYRRTQYIADFMYFDVEKGHMVVEDVKGFKTDVYKLKKKLFEYNYPDLEINEVK